MEDFCIFYTVLEKVVSTFYLFSRNYEKLEFQDTNVELFNWLNKFVYFLYILFKFCIFVFCGKKILREASSKLREKKSELQVYISQLWIYKP